MSGCSSGQIWGVSEWGVGCPWHLYLGVSEGRFGVYLSRVWGILGACIQVQLRIVLGCS